MAHDHTCEINGERTRWLVLSGLFMLSGLYRYREEDGLCADREEIGWGAGKRSTTW